MAKTDIEKWEPGSFVALNMENAELQEILADNLGGEQINEFDLPIVKMPSGGGAFWEVPSLGGVAAENHIEGVVVAFKRTRSYWKNSEPDGSPPDCVSNDTITGVGDPGGECATCPFAQFGSDKDERGQACTEREVWFVLQKDAYLPIVVTLPPTSLAAARKYRVQLSTNGISISHVVTRLGLTTEANPTGQSYSKAVVSLGALLDPEDRVKSRAYAESMRETFNTVARKVAAGEDIIDGETGEPIGDEPEQAAPASPPPAAPPRSGDAQWAGAKDDAPPTPPTNPAPPATPESE